MLEGRPVTADWGSTALLAPFVGRTSAPVGGAPHAEVWFGAHHRHPSWVVVDGARVPCTEVAGLAQPTFLVKLLAASAPLSIQVHPPADIAPSLHGEPKTEMWYIVDADPDAELYVGLKEGVTHDAFERGLDQGATASQVHALSPQAGEFIFIPSGRLHAIGAGLLIFEIQQNSDTTYRVFDWNAHGGIVEMSSLSSDCRWRRAAIRKVLFTKCDRCIG